LTNFKEEYMAGRTPNPCVMCNSMIKFEALPRSAKAAGIEFDRFATGHYARVSFDGASSRYRLQRAVDLKKDQSYFLYRLKQEQLSQILLPLGEYTKEQVRESARRYGLKVSDKPDSQDFYSGDINDILQAEPKIGNFVDKNGKILGKHQGIWHFTIGQRKGLGISADRPLYVIGLNPERNEVVLGYDEDGYQTSLTASRLNWVSVPSLGKRTTLFAKLRSSQQPVEVSAVPVDDDRIEIDFIEQQKAIAAGQSVVLYDREGFVWGGGVIDGKK
jgi:tRNA-specific 2-thiouridylase